MYDGDLKSIWVPDREEAIKKSIELIGQDSNKCASICHNIGVHYVCLKKSMTTRPYELAKHGICETIFFRDS